MKVLFVVPYPEGQAASQRYRVEQWLPLLQEQDIKYRLAPFWSQSAWNVLYKPQHTWRKITGLLTGFMNRMLLLRHLPVYDFVFVHREATPLGPPWFEWVAAKVFRKRIIFDFDDAIWLPNTTAENRWAAKLKWHHKTAQICRWSYKVSCGNGYLRNYALKYNAAAVLLPSVLDTEHRYNEHKEQHTQEVVMGWIGSHSTLPYLQLVEPVLQRLERKYSFRLLVIADKAPQLQLRSLEFKAWQRETEVQDLLQLNIGLMPLPDTEWAKGKCAFKALQYMALGIPAVVSGVGANIEAVANGCTGYPCATEQEWYERLEALLLKPELRTSMGAEGQVWVRKHYSLQAHSQTFLSLFSS
ncbi:glycosyltransferase family 1 protein [Pontibacter diazotrophicus]|uniref:Glycosyltransferase family 1 protein n=1 Tax=Pontibacter diazotrophicus TaxID=1400979 RepID=A0A3D8LI17_9BACT|nr:glycosyltransferase family 4 protein [Pontibacter diazotrophicus]RDV17091.1 glycosyltransferase family 1 protein [Pontibacter diazotrophicus]